MLNPRGFFRFVRKFFTHPGTWVFLALLAVGLGFALPFVAPALMIFAAVAIGLATIFTAIHLGMHFKNTLIPKLREQYDKSDADMPDDDDDLTVGNYITLTFRALKDWAKDHKVQAIIVGVGIGLLITALVLTIGFFTGGAAFAFMAPVFAAIAAPFATAAAAAGLQLGLAALAGTTFVLAALNITNIFHRLADWFDSFKYDYAAQVDNNKGHGKMDKDAWEQGRENAVAAIVDPEDGIGYFPAIFFGMAATIKNGLASVDEDKLDPPPPPSHQYQKLV